MCFISSQNILLVSKKTLGILIANLSFSSLYIFIYHSTDTLPFQCFSFTPFFFNFLFNIPFVETRSATNTIL
jgi:hypothetical protein